MAVAGRKYMTHSGTASMVKYKWRWRAAGTDWECTRKPYTNMAIKAACSAIAPTATATILLQVSMLKVLRLNSGKVRS